jgi:dolichyl-phosphate-mannose-protein mannosyltransferase
MHVSTDVRTRPGAPAPVPDLSRPAVRSRRRSVLLVPFAVVALAAGLRTWNLTFPAQTIADEGYYASDAENYLGGGVDYVRPPFETIPEDGTWMHPPLGKELIALGVGPLGDRPVGWRLPSAVAGTAGVWLVYVLAMRLWRSRGWAALAASLVALDGLHIVMSRLAMLDIFLAAFVTAGFLFVERARPSPTGVGWTAAFGGTDLLLAGAMFGGAVAVKWSGAFALVVAVAMLAAAGVPARRLALSLVVVPLAVYAAAYVPFWVAHGPDVAAWVRLQSHMLSRQLGTTSPNPLASSPLSWPPMLRPLTAFPNATGPIPAGAARIVAVGNPVLWWGFLLAAPLLVALAVRGRDRGARVAAAGYLSMWAPWLLFGRTEYLYYLTPAVPFMAIALVSAIRALGRARVTVAVATAVAAVGAAVAFAPVWLGLHAPAAWYDAIRLLPTWR